MAFSKIILNGITQIDLTQDTVAAANLLTGETAHGADGQAVVGAASGGGGVPEADFIKFIEGTEAVTLDFSEVTHLREYALYASKLTKAYFPKVTSVTGGYILRYAICPVIVLPVLATVGNHFLRTTGAGLHTADFGALTKTGTYFVNGCSALTTIILRSSTVLTLGSGSNSFEGSPFASNGAGGTIYIPKSLYEHLGDGSASDYKVATNWSTYDSYGKITWAQIEGSIYEHAYADGTPIPTA